jgi:hypothetical protein
MNNFNSAWLVQGIPLLGCLAPLIYLAMAYNDVGINTLVMYLNDSFRLNVKLSKMMYVIDLKESKQHKNCFTPITHCIQFRLSTLVSLFRGLQF